MLNVKKMLIKIAEAIATIPTALSQLTDDSTHRTVTDAEKTTWNGKADASILTDMFKTVAYVHSYSNLAAGATLLITPNDLGLTVPTGYTPIGFVTAHSGLRYVDVIWLNAAATGTNNLAVLYNHSSSDRTGNARFTILYVKSSLVTAS